ncbi:MAG: sugar ABC transporter permease [Chloroflexi bacterium]|nr:sugar ABC transporter permease [Chloroflexota bacterium]MDL1883298.1 sugar ABC transporter permease [Anaerolineae bacterium CFX8]GIL13385.1 MAG: sugar ABC transporter permease [Chloroflexota bacterium]
MSISRFRVLSTPYEQAQTDRRRRQWDKALFVALFTLPGMSLFFLFVLIPIMQSAYFSLYDWNGFGPPTKFIEFDNYTRLLNHSIFQTALVNSFTLMILSLTIQLPLALSLALLVGRGKLHGKKFFRTVLFVPYVFSEVITAIIWRYVLSPNEGALLNALLGAVIPNFQPVGWLADRHTVIYVLFAVLTWKYFGFHMILYMAGLQGIPADLEDAARVDGGTEWQVLRFITLPLLGSTIRLTVFLSVLGSFQQFVLAWVLTNEGGPVNASQLIATYLYKFGITQLKLGYGSAVAVVFFAITLVFSLGYQRMIMRRDYAAN